MPVKITNQPSDPRRGLINQEEMNDAISRFATNAVLTSNDPTRPINKSLWCWFKRDAILKLLGVSNADPSNISGIRIYFGVHPDGQASCEGEDLSNFLNTMIFATTKNNEQQEDIDGIDKPMLLPGYNSNGTFGDADCCGGMGKGG